MSQTILNHASFPLKERNPSGYLLGKVYFQRAIRP